MLLRTLEGEADEPPDTDEALRCTSVSRKAQGWEPRGGLSGRLRARVFRQKGFVGKESWRSIPGRRCKCTYVGTEGLTPYAL